ncbi:hypothetical protein FJZ40_00460 [Candidatus Shapirobacteria bacterium]|nr:hypothetical protein [Candidatus Shapirobacteria bacterium]
MTNKRWVTRFCAVLFFFCAFPWPSEARAQTFSLGIWPPLLEAMIQPGKAITQVYKISNFGDDIILTPKVIPFLPSGEKGELSFPGLNIESQTSSPWFSLQNADLRLDRPLLVKSGEIRELVLKIKIPGEARENDYYHTFLLTTGGEELLRKELSQNASQSRGYLGANILITVSRDGQPVKKGEIEEFAVKAHKFSILDSFEPIKFNLKAKNSGKTLWKPFGKITINDSFGHKAETELLPQNVLANSSRQLTIEPFPLNTKFSILNTLFNRFRARVEFTLDEKGPSLWASTVFYVLPIKITIAFLLIILLLVAIKAGLKDKKSAPSP